MFTSKRHVSVAVAKVAAVKSNKITSHLLNPYLIAPFVVARETRTTVGWGLLDAEMGRFTLEHWVRRRGLQSRMVVNSSHSLGSISDGSTPEWSWSLERFAGAWFAAGGILKDLYGAGGEA